MLSPPTYLLFLAASGVHCTVKYLYQQRAILASLHWVVETLTILQSRLEQDNAFSFLIH